MAFCVMIACLSCAKDANHEYPFPNDGLKVKTVTEGILAPNGMQFQHIYNYAYDSIGRLIWIETDSSFTNFKYTGNFMEKNIYPVSNPTQHYYYYYNNDDRLDSAIFFEESSTDTNHTVYVYDVNNLVIKREEKTISSPGVLKDTSMFAYKYDSKGNLLGIKGYGPNSSETEFVYSDSANYHDISEQVTPDGVKNPNLLISSSSSSLSPSGGISYYKYKIDIFGRVEEIQVEQTILGLKVRKLLTYTYY